MIIPVEYLRECFDADFETGELRWRERPRRHFLTDGGCTAGNRHAGKLAGTLDHASRLRVTLTVEGKVWAFLAHRIVWALAHARWPSHEIDHRDGNPSNNRLANLREATHQENHQNVGMHKDNASGFLGVTRASKNRWSAQICVRGRKSLIGLFPDRQSAFNAYLEAKARLHPFQPVPR